MWNAYNCESLSQKNLVAGQCNSRFHTFLTANTQRSDAMQGNNTWERLFPSISILVSFICFSLLLVQIYKDGGPNRKLFLISQPPALSIIASILSYVVYVEDKCNTTQALEGTNFNGQPQSSSSRKQLDPHVMMVARVRRFQWP